MTSVYISFIYLPWKNLIFYFAYLYAVSFTLHFNVSRSLEVLIEKIQEARAFIRSIAYEIWTYVYSYNESYLRPVFVRLNNFKEKVQEKCRNSNECKSLVRAYQTGDWKTLLQELRALILSLPGKIFYSTLWQFYY